MVDIDEVKDLFELPTEKKTEDKKKEEGNSDVYGETGASDLEDGADFADKAKELESIIDAADKDGVAVAESTIVDSGGDAEEKEDSPEDDGESSDPLDAISSAVEEVRDTINADLGLDDDEEAEDVTPADGQLDLFSEEEKEGPSGADGAQDPEAGEADLDALDEEDSPEEEPAPGPAPEPASMPVIPEGVCEAAREAQTADDDVFDAHLLPDGKYSWMVKSPAPKYDKFYEKKRYVINKCCIWGQIPFDAWRKELRESSVDVSVPSYDPQEIQEKMQVAHKYRERVKEMQTQINSQYFMWKRAIVLMRGSLARVESDKPVIKQEGVYYEHMHDIELYFAEIEGIHDVAEKVNKTLESAFECLSRQVTINMPLKPIERKSYQSKPGATKYGTTDGQQSSCEDKKSDEKDDFSDLDGLPMEGDVPITNNRKKDDEPATTSGPRSVGIDEIGSK